jgi:catechol 2,3-dioxygenase
MIDPATTIDAVRLTISDLPRSVAFYTGHLGLTIHKGDERTASLGTGGPDLVVLSQSKTAPRVRGTTGLYHFALVVPSRADLASSLLRLAETETMLQGAADHGVSESLYLADPDGNGIEIYRDRPRADWPVIGGVLQMGVEPLDLDELLGELGSTGSKAHVRLPDMGPVRMKMGHVHLHVANLVEAESFYAGVLGFDVMQRYGSTALFVAAGGYHHHIGLNTWAGVGAPPAPPGAIGLRDFVVKLSGKSAHEAVVTRLRDADVRTTQEDGGVLVHDPSGNALLITS